MNRTENIWSLQDAKAQLSKLVRFVETEGPQILTVHGRKKVVLSAYIESSDESATGAELITILENSPLRELSNEPFSRSNVYVKNRQVEF
jgi:prevent-host-death family protein